MPYILSPIIKLNTPGMWAEGDSYSQTNLYTFQKENSPPIHYDEHVIRPHSLTHLETPGHTQENGKRLDYYYKNHINYFYGKVLIIKLSGNFYHSMPNGIFHWEVTPSQVKERLEALRVLEFPDKLFITTEIYFENQNGFHDPSYVLTLSQDTAEFLISHKNFHLFGTSWKSSDFKIGSRKRPIHDILFKQALILENLKLNDVPEGKYFLSAFPLPFENATESPLVPILYSEKEMLSDF